MRYEIEYQGDFYEDDQIVKDTVDLLLGDEAGEGYVEELKESGVTTIAGFAVTIKDRQVLVDVIVREDKKFARKCDCCGKGMNEGYLDSGSYYCSDRCLLWGNSSEGLNTITDNQVGQYSMIDWKRDCEENEDECYYTEWEEIDEDGYYLEDGERVDTCTNCHEEYTELVNGDLEYTEGDDGAFCPNCLQQID